MCGQISFIANYKRNENTEKKKKDHASSKLNDTPYYLSLV